MKVIGNHIVVGILAAIVLWGELLLAQQKFLFGVLLYGVTLLALLLYGAYRWETPQRQLIVLTIPAVVRLVAFSLPLGNLSPMFTQLIVSVPLTFMAVTFVWLMKDGQLEFRFDVRQIPIYLILISAGAGAGYLLFQIQSPARLVWDSPLLLFFYVIVLVAGMAFLEEWLFRSIMQTALESLIGGGFAVLAVAIFYSILNVGQGSTLFVSVIFLVSVGLGLIRRTENGFLSVCLVHGTANLVYFLVLPML
jgi:uncharacterized protein